MQRYIPAIVALLAKPSGRYLAALIKLRNFRGGEYSRNGRSQNVDVSAALQGGPLQRQPAGGLGADVQFHLHASAVRQKSVKRLFSLGRRYKRNALVSKLVEKNLLGKLAGC